MAQKELVIYQTETGKRPFDDWLKGLKDIKARARIRSRLDRVELGQYGDYKPVGEGVYELRLFFGPGYRTYFAEDGNTLVLLLCGGDKGSQERDVRRAHAYWQDYRERKGGD